MRITATLNDELVADAMEYTGIRSKSLLVRFALKQLIQGEAARRLAAMGGTQPHLKPIPRRWPPTFRSKVTQERRKAGPK